MPGSMRIENGFVRVESKPTDVSPIKKQFGCISFDKGGYYCIREKDTFSFIRCGRHKDRPAHADNLHLDIWYQGENGGSYKYNTTENYFDILWVRNLIIQ